MNLKSKPEHKSPRIQETNRTISTCSLNSWLNHSTFTILHVQRGVFCCSTMFIEMRWKPRPSHHVRHRVIVVVNQLNHMRRSSIWKLSYVELHRKARHISYSSFTTGWLNRQDNNNNLGFRYPRCSIQFSNWLREWQLFSASSLWTKKFFHVLILYTGMYVW